MVSQHLVTSMPKITTTPDQITIITDEGLELTYTLAELKAVIAKEVDWLRTLLKAKWEYVAQNPQEADAYQWLMGHKEFI